MGVPTPEQLSIVNMSPVVWFILVILYIELCCVCIYYPFPPDWHLQTHSAEERGVTNVRLCVFHHHQVMFFTHVKFGVSNCCNSSALSLFEQIDTFKPIAQRKGA